MADLATLEQAQTLGLNPDEFQKINEILGRTPNFTELSIYSVMWSEHCSYKNSITWLKTLPKEGDKILAKAGEENAGLVDIGNGLACCFKIESHNHPSAIEPYQGAATGVGGINRDIFTMGARPIAQLNSLRFGSPEIKKNKWLIKGVVKGIGDYGNAFGVPTVGGETFFDDSFNVNPLVNAMSVGIVEIGKSASAIAKGEGNPVFIVGSRTGKDGIHGATFASGDLNEDSAKDLPAVQVGDPFQEKLLLEASLEVINTGAVVGIQDMGAAGITCSTSEMSAKGESGMDIYLDKVPTRQEGMKPFEILLSESQERMLVVVEKGKEAIIQAVFDKWDLPCVEIGTVNNSGILKYYMDGELVAEVPAESLVLGGGAPIYTREYKEASYVEEINKFNIDEIEEPSDIKPIIQHLLSQPNICSKNWISEQYDSMVGTINRTTNQISDASIVNLKGTDSALAMVVDCNSRYVYADPEKGAAIAVSEAARNIVCSGGEPLAVTNCLNFGNPYNPEVYWQFVGAIKGMSKACTALNTPVTGGNVSFYNQSSYEGPVFPSPVIGMIGIIDNAEKSMSLDFKQDGDLIYLIGASKNDVGSSQYAYTYLNVKYSSCPHFEMEEELLVHKAVKAAIKNQNIESAHDVSDGGLFVSLFESALAGGFGFEIETDSAIRKDAFLFGEAQSRVVVSVDEHEQPALEKTLNRTGVPYSKIGRVTKSKDIVIDGEKIGNVTKLRDTYMFSLNKILDQE